MKTKKHFRFVFAMGSKHSNSFDHDYIQLWIVVSDKNHSGINARIYKRYGKSTLQKIIAITEGYRKNTQDNIQ